MKIQINIMENHRKIWNTKLSSRPNKDTNTTRLRLDVDIGDLGIELNSIPNQPPH